ncbi:MAG: superoxide dismutase [Pseudomonadota bacterium]
MTIYSPESNQPSAPFVLLDLPYSKDALEPYFTAENFDYHHGKHHNAYVVKLNELLGGKSALDGMSLEEIILKSHQNPALQGIFNNAAQIWNHTFYWHSMKEEASVVPEGVLLEAIERDFGSFEKFKEEFRSSGIAQFGSGWVWLVLGAGKLQIVKTGNAETPITQGLKPILACDVWEHAYYIDYRNRRADYLEIFLEHLVNWDFAAANFTRV